MTHMLNVPWALAETSPRGVALRFEGRTYTFGRLRSASSSFAERLEDHGVAAGDRVVVALPTGPEFVFVYYGILAVGAIAVTVNPASVAAELDHIVKDSGARLVVAWPDTAAAGLEPFDELRVWIVGDGDVDQLQGRIRTLHRVEDEDAAVVLYTSGTTGRPKGAVLTHANINAAVDAFVSVLGARTADRFGTALPLFHVFGQVAVLGVAHRVGAGLSMLRPFTGNALLELIAEDRLSIVSGVPTMWNEVLVAGREDLDTSSFRVGTSGGAPLPVEIVTALGDRFGVRVLEGYGLSESTAAVTLTLGIGTPQPGSVGPPLPGVKMRIVEETGDEVIPGEVGEVIFRGATLMSGYWGDPEGTASAVRDGWFYTGDLGRWADGTLWIVDRKKDMVIRGGYNVYPREVEEVLYEHPRVREAAVVGVPDARLGEEVAAVVGLTAGPTLDAAELRSWVELRLARYKVPRLYAYVTELPKGSTGKILKRDIDRDELLRTARRVSRPASSNE